MQQGGVGADLGQLVAATQTRKDGEMHRTTLRRLEELFAHRGDAHVLVALRGSEPLTFTELAQRIHEHSDVRVSDNTISRSLSHLDHDGHTACDKTDPRHPTYQLTEQGEQCADLIALLVEALEDHART